MKRRRGLRIVAWVFAVGVGLPVLAIAALRVVPPLVTPFMVLRALSSRAGWDYHWVPRRAIAPAVARAVIAAEDTRFVAHHGFDWTEVQSAFEAQQRGRPLRGASTISMQCARSLFLWPGRDVVRKAIEAYLTVLLEALWPKARILEMYLNIVEWGDGIYGCEAAAQRHLGVACAALNTEQAARLAAILPNPRHWSASHPGPYVRSRVDTILDRMPQVAVPRW